MHTNPITAARAATWADMPDAAALLADCAANPPRRVSHVDRYAVSCDHWSEYSRRDLRVKALIDLWEAAFTAIEAAGLDAEPVLSLTPDVAIERAVEAAAMRRIAA